MALIAAAVGDKRKPADYMPADLVDEDQRARQAAGSWAGLKRTLSKGADP